MADGVSGASDLTSCALLIGNATFKYLSQLPDVKQELKTMEYAFQLCGVVREAMFPLQDCDEGKLRAALQSCYDFVKQRPTIKTCFVYISSHGIEPAPEGAAAQAPSEGGVCACESGGDWDSFKGLTTTDIRKSLFWPLSKLGVNILCILDVCFAGSVGQPKDARPKAPGVASPKAAPPGDQVIAPNPPVNSVIIHVARCWEKAYTNAFANAFYNVIQDSAVYNDSDQLTVFRLFKELKGTISGPQAPVLSAYVEDDFVIACMDGTMEIDPVNEPIAHAKGPRENSAEIVCAVLSHAASKRPTWDEYFSAKPLKPIVRYVKLEKHIQHFEANWLTAFGCLEKRLEETKLTIESEICILVFGEALVRCTTLPDFDDLFAVQKDALFKGICGLVVLTALAIDGDRLLGEDNGWPNNVPDDALLQVAHAESGEQFEKIKLRREGRWKCVLASLRFCGCQQEDSIWDDDDDVIEFATKVFYHQPWFSSSNTPPFDPPNTKFWSAFWAYHRKKFKIFNAFDRFANAMQWAGVSNLKQLSEAEQRSQATRYKEGMGGARATGNESSEFKAWLENATRSIPP